MAATLIFELTNVQWAAYVCGGLGIFVEWRAYWLQCSYAFRQWSAAGALLWSIQYFLLDAWTAGLTIGATALRTLLSARSEQGLYRHCIPLGFISLFALITKFSWQGIPSLLPAFAVINTTLALFYLDNRNMRITLLFSSVAWIANDLYWNAWPALFAESVAMGINLKTIRKLTKAECTVFT